MPSKDPAACAAALAPLVWHVVRIDYGEQQRGRALARARACACDAGYPAGRMDADAFGAAVVARRACKPRDCKTGSRRGRRRSVSAVTAQRGLRARAPAKQLRQRGESGADRARELGGLFVARRARRPTHSAVPSAPLAHERALSRAAAKTRQPQLGSCIIATPQSSQSATNIHHADRKVPPLGSIPGIRETKSPSRVSTAAVTAIAIASDNSSFLRLARPRLHHPAPCTAVHLSPLSGASHTTYHSGPDVPLQGPLSHVGPPCPR
jgi:hypothetical protein